MILGLKSVGGFLTHCVWNSVLESIVNGVPMIAWPLFAEQRMNATILMEELGVAIKSQVLESKGFVGREEIEKLVRKVMEEKEGIEMRVRVKELKCRSEKAFSKGGSFYNSLCQVAKDCKA
jgi:coniferyl-alcohol glucosyltransferase